MKIKDMKHKLSYRWLQKIFLHEILHTNIFNMKISQITVVINYPLYLHVNTVSYCNTYT